MCCRLTVKAKALFSMLFESCLPANAHSPDTIRLTRTRGLFMHKGPSLDELNWCSTFHINQVPILGGNINCHWVEVQLGILSFQADNTFPRNSVFLERKIFFPVGQKTQLNGGPQGLDLGTSITYWTSHTDIDEREDFYRYRSF